MKKLLIAALLLLSPSLALASETINFQSGPATDVNGYGQVAQQLMIDANTPFTTTSTWTNADFAVQLAKNGTPTNHSVFTIWSSVGGTPTTLLYTSDTSVDNSTLGSDTAGCATVHILFSHMTLAAGNYFIAGGVDTGLSNANKPLWCSNDSEHYWSTLTTASTWTNQAFNFAGMIGSVTFSSATPTFNFWQFFDF